MTLPSKVTFLFVLMSFLKMPEVMLGKRTHAGHSLSKALDLTKLPGCESYLSKQIPEAEWKLSPSTDLNSI